MIAPIQHKSSFVRRPLTNIIQRHRVAIIEQLIPSGSRSLLTFERPAIGSMNGDVRMEVDDDGADTDGELETRYGN